MTFEDATRPGMRSRRGLSPAEADEFQDLIEDLEHETKRLQTALWRAEFKFTLGGAPGDSDFVAIETLLEGIESICDGLTPYVTRRNVSLERRRRKFVEGEIARLRALAQERAAVPNPVYSSGPMAGPVNVADYRLEFPEATDEEVRCLAQLGLRLEELERVIRGAAAPEPEGVIVAGALPAQDEYDRLSHQFSQLRTIVRLRAAPPLKPLTPDELRTLDADYADWLNRDVGTRIQESRGLLYEALLGVWGPHVEARAGLGAGAAVGERGAYWRLLCLSRGFIPSGERPPDVAIDVALEQGDGSVEPMFDFVDVRPVADAIPTKLHSKPSAQTGADAEANMSVSDGAAASASSVGVLGEQGDSGSEALQSACVSDQHATPTIDADVEDAPASKVNDAAERRKLLARQKLHALLGPANYDLREHYKKKDPGRRTVTIQELASKAGRDRSHLSKRAKEVDFDLTPYRLLYGPLVYDPLMVIEKP